jgi:DNA-binding response OmpR family regulator
MKGGGCMAITKPTILCVDDQPEILNFLEAMLLPKAYEVIKAENGLEALEKLNEQRVDLVILDVKMPKMDGFEACRRIKEDDRYRNIPVVMITGITANKERIKGIEAGAEDFISKPFDPEEILARIKMLLKAKSIDKRRIGELFVDMGFINEEQLQKALTIAEEQNIKVGEALYTMGALDKDHIYWVLSNQMNMNYLELSPEMIDKELIIQFSIDTLEELLCLPLYETAEEIHFAISDPTDQQIVKKIKSLRPEKTVQLHLALPEKIMDILNLYKGKLLQPQICKPIQSEEEGVYPLPAKSIESQRSLQMDSDWSHLVDVLLSMSQGESYWFYRMSHECRLISRRGETSETVHEYPEEIYLLLKERLEEKMTSPTSGGEKQLFLEERSTRRQGAFKLWEGDFLNRDMTRIERIPAFSQKEFMMSHPKAPGLIKDLQQLFREHQRLLIGGRETLNVKQCCYSLLLETETPTHFPPPFFIEKEIELYFSKAAQLSAAHFDPVRLLTQFKGMPIPFLFYETESSEMPPEEKNLSQMLSGSFNNIILYVPFSTPEIMRKTLSGRDDWHRAGFKALFFSPCQLESI